MTFKWAGAVLLERHVKWRWPILETTHFRDCLTSAVSGVMMKVMKNKKILLLPVVLMVSVFAATSCQKEKSTSEKIEEAVKDATDTREHEEIKDALEEVKEAAVDMKDATKEAVGDALDTRENEEAKDAIEEAQEAVKELGE